MTKYFSLCIRGLLTVTIHQTQSTWGHTTNFSPIGPVICHLTGRHAHCPPSAQGGLMSEYVYRRTMIVVSEDYGSHQWTRLEWRQARHQAQRDGRQVICNFIGCTQPSLVCCTTEADPAAARRPQPRPDRGHGAEEICQVQQLYWHKWRQVLGEIEVELTQILVLKSCK